MIYQESYVYHIKEKYLKNYNLKHSNTPKKQSHILLYVFI